MSLYKAQTHFLSLVDNSTDNFLSLVDNSPVPAPIVLPKRWSKINIIHIVISTQSRG
jgi:hypothetical protein